jgi:signal transduction histidine kinase
VEDNPTDALLVCELCRQQNAEGIQITCVERLDEAIKQLAEQEFDLILLDLGLPDSSGLMTLTQIRKADSEMPIVVLSSLGDQDMAMQAVQQGAQDFLPKGLPSGESIVRCIHYAIERKRCDETEHQRNALNDAVRSIERVLDVVGHELRTPLAALRAMAEFLLMPRAMESDQGSAFLHSIIEEVVRMSETVNNMIEAVHLNSGKSTWNWDTVSFQSTCDEAMGNLGHSVDQTKVKLSCEIQPPELTMQGDAMGIRQLIMNLLGNAARHTHEGFIHISVRGRQEPEGTRIEIEVSDSGEGIPHDLIDKLGGAFELNAGCIGSDYVQGAGLGLVICNGIAAAHGGLISVKSAEGVGSVFTVEMPADLAEPMAIAGTVRIVRKEIS